MGSRDVELAVIAEFIPPGAVQRVLDYLHRYAIHLKIRRERKTKYGDYCPAHQGLPHTITVNGNLNPYHFLVTLLHEIAHLNTHVQYGRTVKPHGREWKKSFALLLHEMAPLGVFPNDVWVALEAYAQNPGASSCSDPALFRALQRYDTKTLGHVVGDLAVGDYFKTHKGERYRVLEKKRTRYVCEHTESRIKYLFPAIHEVFKENHDL